MVKEKIVEEDLATAEDRDNEMTTGFKTRLDY